VRCQRPDCHSQRASLWQPPHRRELHDLHLTPRRKLLGDWFCEGDLGFIFAFRGVGKTWLALAIAQALSTGGKLGDWQAHEPVRVLYIDGEMPPDLMRGRCKGLEATNANLHFLNHEILFDRAGRVLNIANPVLQEAITMRCVTSGVKVLILDNLSTLASGMKENEADSWELVNNWLLDLRRRKIAVVIVHHAGRSGEMRGTLFCLVSFLRARAREPATLQKFNGEDASVGLSHWQCGG
jgi:putative DNA primase/helicase